MNHSRPSDRRIPRRRGSVARGVLVALVLAAIVLALMWLARRAGQREVVVPPAGTVGMEQRPVAPPPPADFEGCPAAGDGGDRALNTLKNRVAPAPPRDVILDSLLALTWPPQVGDRMRSRWPAAATRAVAPAESRGVRVVAYLAMARLVGPESTNCHGEEARHRDYHLWLTTAPGLGRERSLIAEMTPRLRAEHPGWTVRRLGEVARRHHQVRVTGWLLLDQEHPEQLGRTRGTLWEIHPVTAFEVFRAGRWVPLDSLSATRGAR